MLVGWDFTSLILISLKDVAFGDIGVWGLHLNICDSFYSLSNNGCVPKPIKSSCCNKIMPSMEFLFLLTRTHGSAPVREI